MNRRARGYDAHEKIVATDGKVAIMTDDYEGFVSTVQDRAGLESSDTADEAIRATLDALAEFLPKEIGSRLSPRHWGTDSGRGGRVLFLGVVFGTGYVLGTKAGRERYHQIVAAWNRFIGTPAVQQVAERGKQIASQAGRRGADAVGQARDAAVNAASKATGQGSAA